MTHPQFRLSVEADDADLRALIRKSPMQSWIHLGLEREPHFSLGEGLFGEAKVLLARDLGGNGDIMGSCACTWMPVHVNGEVQQVPYLSGLRLAAAYRNHPHLLRNGFRALDEFAGFGPTTPFAFTSLASDNHLARRLLERGLPGFPQYRPLAELDTWVLPTGGRLTGRLEPAAPSDLPELVHRINEAGRAAQCSPHITEAWLACGPGGLQVEDFLVRRERGSIVTCLALWDQRAFKQVRIHGYRAPLNLLRAPLNLWSTLRRGLRLPAPGSRLEAGFLAFASFQQPDWKDAGADVAESLAWASRRGLEAGLLGLPVGHPLGPWLRHGRAPWTYRTYIEEVRWPSALPLTLEPRPVHPEIALL